MSTMRIIYKNCDTYSNLKGEPSQSQNNKRAVFFKTELTAKRVKKYFDATNWPTSGG